MRAIWNGEVIAQSDDTVIVEGNHYFPADSVNKQFLAPSDLHTYCPWKGEASYYTIESGGKVNHEAAWYYPQTKPGARHIQGYVAFWKGVEIKP